MNQEADNLAGIPAYIGEEVATPQVEEKINDAETSLAFIQARNGQIAYTIEALGLNKNIRIDTGDTVLNALEARNDLQERFEKLDSYDKSIAGDLETVTYSEATSFRPVNLEEVRSIPEFDIDDWSWPRENLWPFQD